MKNEDMAVNNVSSGAIAGTGGAGGEPGVRKKRKLREIISRK